MNNYIKQFRPLTSEDVEIIAKNQGNAKDICVMLQKELVTDPEIETINLVVEIIPQANTLVMEYYILPQSLSAKGGIPQLITKELYLAHMNETEETPTIDFPIPTVEEVQVKIVKSLSNSDWITRSSAIKMIDNIILPTLGSEADIKFWEGISDMLKQKEKS